MTCKQKLFAVYNKLKVLSDKEGKNAGEIFCIFSHSAKINERCIWSSCKREVHKKIEVAQSLKYGMSKQVLANVYK